MQGLLYYILVIYGYRLCVYIGVGTEKRNTVTSIVFPYFLLSSCFSFPSSFMWGMGGGGGGSFLFPFSFFIVSSFYPSFFYSFSYLSSFLHCSFFASFPSWFFDSFSPLPSALIIFRQSKQVRLYRTGMPL